MSIQKSSYPRIRLRLRDVLDEHRERTGERLTYEQLAERTGLSPSTLASLASRGDYNATLSTVAVLCDALDCEPGDLLVLERAPS